MKRIVITYGLIAGAIVAIMMFITMPMYESGQLNFDNGELVGYTTMAVAFSMIFIAIKSYRDSYADGEITFWTGTKVGLFITAIAAVMYAGAWEITYRNMTTDFMQKIQDHRIEKMIESGAPAAEIAKTKEGSAAFAELYKNPFFRFSVTLLEIVPVGLVVTLISAFLLRRKDFLPAQTKVTNATTA